MTNPKGARMKTSLLTAAALSLALVGCGPATKVDTAKTATSVADKHAGMAMGGHDDDSRANDEACAVAQWPVGARACARRNAHLDQYRQRQAARTERP
ncbi:MAG: hypothetical protein C0454_18075, partial [Parvibaculum sp.]|nr:hypothetical protein [Parvibaculum sp.]